jgi:hypothetical protein
MAHHGTQGSLSLNSDGLRGENYSWVLNDDRVLSTQRDIQCLNSLLFKNIHNENGKVGFSQKSLKEKK